jgi:pimeloyl-ACP methyl ester carboxylesterase
MSNSSQQSLDLVHHNGICEGIADRTHLDLDAWWSSLFPQGRQTLTIRDGNDRPIQIAYGQLNPNQSGPNQSGSNQSSSNQASKSPIVLAHGLGAWSYHWRGMIPGLAAHYPVTSFDAKGYGCSAKPGDRNPADHLVTELIAILEQLFDQPVILVGESLGALTALGVAQRRPDLVKSLVLINAPVFPEVLPNWGMRLVAGLPLGLVKAFDRGNWIQLFGPVLRAVIAIASRNIVADPSHLKAYSEANRIALYPYFNLPGAITHYADDLQIGLRELACLQRPDPVGFLAQIQAQLPQTELRTLVIWGDRDNWFPLPQGQRLAAALPNAQLVVIPNCGHHASGECPQALNRAILEFLAKSN